MAKEKVRKFITNNQRKLLAIGLIVLFIIFIISINVYANKNDDYVVEIKDNGSQNIASDENSRLTKKIVEDTSKSLTYEVQVENLADTSIIPEVAIVIDSSKSMKINDNAENAKIKAKQLVTELLNNFQRTKISISSNSGIKTLMSNSTLDTYINTIDNITYSDSKSVEKAIDYATNTFNNENTDKYLIIFSDATDSIKDKLEQLTQSGIEIYSMLTDITNSEYQNSKLMGNVQMVSNISNFSNIYYKTSKSMINVEVNDVFPEEVNNYFDFEVISKEDDLEIEKNSNGYILKCNEIKVGEIKTLKYKITLKKDANIDAGKIYRTLKSSNNIDIKYQDWEKEQQEYKTENSPTFVICKKYSLTIKAVSEKSNDLPVKDLDVKVIGTIVTGKDEQGNDITKTIYDKTVTTDSKGKIILDELKTLGDIKFEIKPLVDQFGYAETSATTIIVHNDPTGVGTIWAESDITTPEVDVVARNINVMLPISVQTYNMKVQTVDSLNSNVKLGNIEYRLIQPKLNSKYDMEALYATSDENGNLIFKPAVMTKDGKYEYILSQLNEQEGYDGIGNATLYVTFKEGKVIEFTHKYNENIESNYISEIETKVIVKNKSENVDTFKLEINVSDSENSNKKLQGAIYDVEVTRIASNGQQVTNTINGCITDLNGKIILDLPGTGNVRVRIKEVQPITGYNEDKTTKEIVFSRTDGRVQYITAKNPIDIDAVADSDANTLVVNFTSLERTGKNRIQVHMIDNLERDVNIPGVNIKLVNVINNKSYTGVSDSNGIINFLVDDESAGIYVYDVILSNSVPYGYINNDSKLGTISIHFNDNKYIDECSDIEATVPYFATKYEIMEESNYAYHTGIVNIGLTPDDANTYNLQVKLVDDKNIALQGAKYNITIESGEIARNIKGRETDANGMLMTRLVGGDYIKITIKQTETINKHIINTQEQIIELTKIAGVYQITNQEPYIYDISSGQNIGAEIIGKNIIYHDLNKEKTANDTILNLYVNKKDINNNLVEGVRTIITSPTLKLKGEAITANTSYTATAKSGNTFTLNPCITDNNGYFEIEGIEVDGTNLNNGERVDYLYMYEIDNNGSKIANTDITLKLTFRNNENKEIIQVTNVEATWGNRLVSNKTFDGYETNIAYESNVYLDIYTNYDDVGNFSLDLTKTDKNNNVLQGAKYDVIVTRVDGTKVIRKGIQITDKVEFEGSLVAEGTKIEITEVEAPIGYELNEYTEMLTITNIDTITGEITVQLETSGYSIPRAILNPIENLILQDGTYKTCATLQLIDYELDTFKIGILAQDATTQNPLEGYKFKISTSQGAQGNTEKTNNEGRTSAVVGANYKNDGLQVIYTIETLNVANYYKKLENPINVIVVFDLNGQVKTSDTITANENQAGYGTIWTIESTNITDGNDINVKINIEPEEKLIVNIISEDRISKEHITNNQYKITPCLNMQGIGTTKIEVGYVIPNAVNTYTLSQTNNNQNYEMLENQQFKIEYDENGDIKAVTELSEKIIDETHNGKEITLTIQLEPLLPVTVNITSKDAITNVILNNIEYELSPSDISNTIGKEKIIFGYVKPQETVEYALKQINELNEYIKLKDLKFELEYSDQDVIINANSLSNELIITSYNERELNIEVKVEPGLPFKITNIGYFDRMNLSDGKFEITSETQITKQVVTDVDGIAKTYVDKLQENTTVIYKIKQIEAARTYSTVEEFEIEVTFDENKYVVDAKLRNESTVNQYVEFITVTHINPSTINDIGYNGNDKGIINIEVKNYPAVQFEITNIDRQDNTKVLSGTNYKITSSTKETGMDTTNPTAQIYVGRGGFSNTITYTINEQSPSNRYQTKAIDSRIEVKFDNRGIIREAKVINAEDITQVSLPGTDAPEDSLKVNVQIQSNPQLGVDINKIDKETGETINGVDFELTARIRKDELSNYTEEEINKISLNTSELTEESYLEEVLERIKITKENVESIKQEIGLYRIVTNLKENNNLTAEEEEKIEEGINYGQKVNILVELGKATKTQINQRVKSVTNQDIIQKLISENKTTQDTVNDILNDIKDLVRLDSNRVTTDQNGNAIAYMNKTLENKTIEYTLKETKKPEGYDWQDEEIRFEITYDETGKMIEKDPIKLVSGNIEITNFDIDEFSVNLIVKNTPSKETKIHLTVEDTYDHNKKLEVAKFDAYLVDKSSMSNGKLTYSPDSKYSIKLETGVTSHGEDIETLGVYEEGQGNRILRLVQRQTPNAYYLGNEQYSEQYQSIAYALLINVTFDDEGHVTNASLYNPGGDSITIGNIADSRYLTVSYSKNTIEVTVKYYPMLQIQMITKDMYTNDALQGKYTISTDKNLYDNTTNSIKSGYIANINDNYYGRNYSINYTTDANLDIKNGNIAELYGATKVGLAPTEADNVPGINIDSRERTFYIFEQEEPTSPTMYQKYRDWHIVNTHQRLIATIKVTYDEIGKIKTTELISERSANNITDGFVEINADKENGYIIQLTIKYAPITTVTATVVDQITGQGLSGIRINPYINNTQISNNSYEYRTKKYYTTGGNGVTSWTYWGASLANGQARYELDSYTEGTGYNGYLDPGNIILDVSYNENGRIAGVTPRSTDAYGDINAINISWENNNIRVTIPYSRKFNVKLNKVDYYDSNTKLGAVFKVVSSENADTTTSANNVVNIGKVYPGKTVKYTLSEITSPNGYIPINNLEFYVTFNNDGTVRSTSSTSDYYKFVKSALVDKDINRVNKTDLEVNIKNKPRFNVSIDLSDKFYPVLKLQGATFEMSNSKGDIAQGEVVTDRNGILETYIGPIYPEEEVEYTIRQTDEVNGYYKNTTDIKFKVKFNASGRIENYSLVSGSGVATIDPNKYVNTKGIHVSITNMPKDLKIGVYKYDELTNKAMDLIKFNTKVEEVGKVDKNTQVVTNADGSVAGVVDTFIESSDYRIVKYTISEIEVPNSYRKIQDVVIQVTFNRDGSIFLYDVLSNESNVPIVSVATNGQIKYTRDNIPVHIYLEIPNDNAYDLIIKDEDKNYEGLGIEGTTYDVTINGEEISPVTTNTNGTTKIVNRTEVGDIEIRIAERNISEGYRADNTNDASILIHKGEKAYSLSLDEEELTNKGYTFTKTANATSGDITYQIVIAQTIVKDQTIDTILILTVNEKYGTITATFKNETKLELNVVKDDINTGVALEGAIFAITSEEIDNRGNTVADTLQTITNTKLVNNDDSDQYYEIDETEKTNKQGLISFDLGLAHQNKTIKYTLVEVKAPEGYTEITPISVTVKFDAYGRITEITDDSFRAECYLDSNTGKSHNMIFNISNGTVDPQYTVKVISEDSQTGTRINGSIFQVEVFDNNGVTYKSETGTTKNVSRTVGNRTFVSEKGVMKVTGIKAQNNIKISLNQVETATGYVFGKNKIVGDVIANAEFIVSIDNLEKDLKLTLINDGGFEVSVDNTNREIIIKVKNDPQLTFDITKVDKDSKEKLSNAEFTVTSEIQTSATVKPTNLKETSKLTDINGHTTLNGGMIYAGKTVIYTLKENKLEGYNQLDDIIILVQYNTNGNIIYYEILSDINDVAVLDGENAKITETKRVLGESNVPGIVEVKYDTYEIPTGIGTKILQLEILNTKEKSNVNNDYKIVIEKHHEIDQYYPYLIPGVVFEVEVKQEYGKAETTWIDITDENGIITSPYFSGYGTITIDITEISTVDGFKLDSKTKTVALTRNKDTHKLDIITANVGYEISEDNSIIYLKPVNEVATNTYNLLINKVDKKDNKLIENNSANIEIYKIEEYEKLIQIENETTGEITYDVTVEQIKEVLVKQETDSKGRIIVSNLKAPQETGTYKYIINETKSPEGYLGLTEEAQIDVTFERNEKDEMIITNAVVVKGNDNVKIIKTLNQLLSIVIENTNENDIVQDGEYVLDITKVDQEQNAIISDSSVFKITDMQTNEISYYETNEKGKLEIPTFKMPETEGIYRYKLNEIKSPNGYILNRSDIIIELNFQKDNRGKIYLNNVNVNGDNAIYKQVQESNLPDTRININIVNEKGSLQPGNTNDKRYTFILNKIDADTNKVITKNAEFEISLANGEIVKGKTNDNGQLIVQEVFMPAKPGDYEFVIKEITSPEGYTLDTEMKIVKVTFTGTEEDMLISDINLNTTNNKNIQIVNEQCTDTKIVLNILNKPTNEEDLYLTSKVYVVSDEYVERVSQNTTIKDYIANMESNGEMKVYDINDNEIDNTKLVGTGMKIVATKGNKSITKIISVIGDLDGNGQITVTDLSMMNQVITQKITVKGAREKSADVDYNGKITITDLAMINQYITGKIRL